MRNLTCAVALSATLACAFAANAASPKPKMATDIPPEITTPDKVETRIGTLKFFDGMPDKETVAKTYDNLDFLRGVEVFLNSMPGASLYAMREGLRGVGVDNQTVAVFETLADSKSLFLTPNTETVYLFGWIDLKDGPIVVETPPNILAFVDDFWFRHVTDMGNAGPDKGKGGKFLFLPPGYAGPVPEGYFVARSTTFGNWLFARGFLVNGDPKPAVESFKKSWRQYPLPKAANPPETKFVNVSGKAFNTIHANNFRYYEEIAHLVQEEPKEAIDPETLGLLAAIGIEKGKPFAPDARMKAILTDAAAVGNATARSILFANRDKDFYLYPNSYWETGFLGGSHEFLKNGARYLDARTRFMYYATGITPAMAAKMVGAGSQYAVTFRDSKGDYLDGGKNYSLRIPPNPPVKNFWSLVLYDGQTRSELQTDMQFPSIGSQKQDLKVNADGSVDLYFGPKAPAGKASNWVQTMPDKSWSTILRLYGPLDPWFDKTWKPGDLELVN
ncbi:DUF1254 domain-containing protein [Bradyrhizobium sp. sGM-13]|uniref:DUF1254 domain-containing protein n=1 Tax=Bradyrhizobium sp. sGM-13 TaxID=2831781 RepID=UPI001BCFA6EC|nr:DUF1254 domain-containing protein [Bradyrhizobium sp. sGM-13]